MENNVAIVFEHNGLHFLCSMIMNIKVRVASVAGVGLTGDGADRGPELLEKLRVSDPKIGHSTSNSQLSSIP